MKRHEHLLTILAEECAEVAQNVSKALRFGVDEVYAAQGISNEQRISLEMHDLIAVYEMLADELVITQVDPDEMMKRIQAKKAKVEKYLAYSKSCGTLE